MAIKNIEYEKKFNKDNKNDYMVRETRISEIEQMVEMVEKTKKHSICELIENILKDKKVTLHTKCGY